MNNDRPTGGIILHNIERAGFLPSIKNDTKICNRNNFFFNFLTSKVEIHSVIINRWKNETNGQKKKFSLTTLKFNNAIIVFN